MLLAEAMFHDRKTRRGLSRRAYAEMTGIKEGRVHALENGRNPQPGEVELLADYLSDLLDPDLLTATVNPAVTPREDATDVELQADAERSALGYDYLAIMQQLGNRIPPHAWPSQFRLETAPPIEFEAIRTWIAAVRDWLRDQDGVVGGSLETAGTEPPAEGSVAGEASAPDAPAPDHVDEVESDWDPVEDDDEWYDVPVETDPFGGPPTQSVEPEVPQLQPLPAVDPVATAEPTQQNGEVELNPEHWHVTNGELRTWKECQRRWFLQNYFQIGPASKQVTGPAALGTRYHAPLAVWYRPTPGDPWEKFESDVKDDRELLEDLEASKETIKSFDDEVDLVRAMLEGYFQWVEETSADAGLTVVEPEAVVKVNPQFQEFPHVRLLGKLDVRVESEADGSRRFMDHKTVPDFTSPVKILHLDEQMLHYHLIEYLTLVLAGLDQEIRAAGAIYNMARKVKRTAQANPPFYLREQVDHSIEELRSYYLRVRATLLQIDRARKMLDTGMDHRDVVPPNPTRDCSWKCEFFTLCPMMDDNTARAQDYIQEQYVKINPLARYEPDAVGETL